MINDLKYIDRLCMYFCNNRTTNAATTPRVARFCINMQIRASVCDAKQNMYILIGRSFAFTLRVAITESVNTR